MKFLEKYIESNREWVTVPVEACALIDNCKLHDEQIIAVLEDGNQVLLLEDCGIGKNGKGIRNIKSLETSTEVYCPYCYIHKLDYSTAEEAIHDFEYNKYLKKEVRKIDIIAYNDWCDKNR